MRKSKGDALLERIVFEAAKEKSAAIRQEEIELNKEPIPEEARARFMRELDKVYPEGGKKRNKAPIRIPRRAIAIAIACVVMVIVLIPATSEAVRRRMNELIKRFFRSIQSISLMKKYLVMTVNTIYPPIFRKGFHR